MPGTDHQAGANAGDAAPAGEAGGLYPIRTVSALTGVNPVTLRAWERRYALIHPQRTPKGHRLYTEADVQRICHVLQLLEQGVSIGQSRRLLECASEQRREMRAPDGAFGTVRDLKEPMAEAVAELDEQALVRIYRKALAVAPIDAVMHALMLPMLAERRIDREETPAAGAEHGFLHAFMCMQLAAFMHHMGEGVFGQRLLIAAAPGECKHPEQLLLALAAIRHGYRASLLGGGVATSALIAALQHRRFRAAIISLPAAPSPLLLEEHLPRIVADGAAPVFVAASSNTAETKRIESAGAIPLAGDSRQALGSVYAHLKGR